MKRAFVIAIFLAGSLLAVGQEKPNTDDSPPARQERPLSFYKVEYVLREMQDGKAINSRNYMMTIENGDRGEAKVGARVPVPIGSSGPSTQWQYMDVGLNISCRVVGRDDYASLHTSIEVSSFALPEQQTGRPESQPVVRQ